MTWSGWRRHFERNALRPLPQQPHGDPTPHTPAQRAALVRSLAVFQRGETGEGRVAREVDHVAYDGVDDHWRAAIKLFVAEEGRHARILGDLVRGLGGQTVEHTWTESAFRHGRGLMGVRLKLLMLMVAEVVGMTFYRLLGEQLVDGPVRRALTQICDDEVFHLSFHAAFFRTQATGPLKALLFTAGWWGVGLVGMAVVVVDHARTLRALDVPIQEAVARFVSGLAVAHQGVLGRKVPTALPAVA